MAELDHSKPTHLPKFDHRILDLTGMRFGRLVVVSFAGRDHKNKILWHCDCDCGNQTLAATYRLRNMIPRQQKRSCGCLIGDSNRDRGYLHGTQKTPAYHTYRSMKSRCYCPTATGYDRYGGRGITVCDRWLDSFLNFLEDMGQPPEGDYSIDRKDNNGNYEKDNCRWATRTEQSNNRRKAKPRLTITFGGETKTPQEWSSHLGIPVLAIYHRRWLGLPVEQVLCRDNHRRPQPRLTIEFNGETRTPREWADHLGIRVANIYFRHKSGLPVDEVLSQLRLPNTRNR